MSTENESNEPITKQTLFVPEFRVEKLFHEFEKLNRKAVKLGLPEITFRKTGNSELREFTITSVVGEGWDTETVHRTEQVVAVEVEVEGVSPTLEGWEFVASVDQVTEGVNILNKAPFSKRTIPARYESATSECEHCKIERNRKSTFILCHGETGDFKQVGRQCLRDFLGNKNPQNLVSAASIFETFATLCGDAEDFSGESCGKQEQAWEISTILTISINCIAKWGWVSRTKAEELDTTSTKERVTNVLFPAKTREGAKYAETFRVSTPEIEAQVAAIIDYIRTNEEQSEYLRNLRAAFSVDYCNGKRLGLVVSAVKAHQTHLAQVAKAEREAARLAGKLDEYFGTIGDRIEIELTIIKLIDCETQYGISTLCLFEDAEGRDFKWFTSSCPFSNSQEGETLKLVATIKDHSEYQGFNQPKARKQTGLTRVKVWEPKAVKPRKSKKNALAGNVAQQEAIPA